MPTRSSALLTLPFLLLLGGCPVWGNGNGSGAPGGAHCVTDGDCSVGYYCDGTTDRCTMTPVCSSDASCEVGEICDFRNTCVPATPGTCRTSDDCNGGDVCVEGSCHTPGPATCQFDLECGPTQTCIDSRCTFTCSTNTDCGSGETCVGSTCTPTTNECTTSNDCSGSESCLEGRCLPPCSSSGTCSDPQDVCDTDGFCHPDWQPKNFCNGNADCAVGSVCDLAAGICRIACDAASTLVTAYNANPNPSCSASSADCACQGAGAQYPTCGFTTASGDDDYCRTAAEALSDCEVATDCTTPGEQCVNGRCQ